MLKGEKEIGAPVEVLKLTPALRAELEGAAYNRALVDVINLMDQLVGEERQLAVYAAWHEMRPRVAYLLKSVAD